MKALITGIAGFAGSYLAEFLLKMNDVELLGLDTPRFKTDNINHISKKIRIYECDICKYRSLFRIIKSVKPDLIFHLAAQAFVPDSWVSPHQSLNINIIGTLNLLESVRNLKLNTKIQIACSAEEYGMVVKTEIPVKETNQLRPLSPYAVGKVSQDMLGFQYNHSYGMFIVRTRAFNHLGPRMKNSLVASNFSKQIAMIEKAKQEPVIYVGNLGVIRDFTDVRDIARAYWLSLKKCKPGEAYNICSGKGYKIKEVLEILLGFSKKKIKIMQERSRFRPSDAPVLIGDNTKFCGQAGWKPKISLERSLEDILNYWRSEV